jgi:opacity protein-like surface antigen
VKRKATFAALAVLVACSTTDGPLNPVPTAQLHFVQQDPAYHLLSDSASFYAKVGEDRRVELFYRGYSSDTGEAFLQFEVHAASLLKRPDGSAFQPGDSILITVTVPDTNTFDFVFSPAGLQFNPADPARLHIEYNYSNHDFNGDGHHDTEDDHAQSLLNVWRREPPDTLWTSQGATNSEEFEDLETAILSFSHYAVAW